MPISTLGDRRGLIRAEQGPQTWLGVVDTDSAEVLRVDDNTILTVDDANTGIDISQGN